MDLNANKLETVVALGIIEDIAPAQAILRDLFGLAKTLGWSTHEVEQAATRLILAVERIAKAGQR